MTWASSCLGIDVPDALLAAWAGWLAPDPQPFLVASPDDWPGCEDEGGTITPELADTYRLWWGVAQGSMLLWLSEAQLQELPRGTRAALVREQVLRRRGAVPTVRAWQDVLEARRLRDQAGGHRFVWWPSLVASDPGRVLARFVATGRLPSRHAEVDERTWRAADAVLPGARHLAGTFPEGSTMNCFGAVMAAAHSPMAAAALDDVAPFETWLASECRPATTRGARAAPGAVLLWRDRDRRPVHAAVALGDGWGLEKPSRDWHSPVAVLALDDIVRQSRHPGERLERHSIGR